MNQTQTQTTTKAGFPQGTAVRLIRLFVGALMMIFAVTVARAASVSFDPATVDLEVGESALVVVDVSDVNNPGLAAFQFRLGFDPAVAEILDPNRGFGLSPFAPLRGNPLCAFVRGVDTCVDPEWFLSSTGRNTVNTVDTSNPEFVDIAYATSGSVSPPTGTGSIALVEVQGNAAGSLTITPENLLLADNRNPPQEFPIDSTGSLTVTVGGVSPNAPPVITGPGDQQSFEGDSVSLQIQASDADGDTIAYSANGLPPGLNIDSASGLISGAPSAGSAGTYEVNVSADDGVNAASETTFVWVVEAPVVNQPPAVTNPGAQSDAEGSAVSLQISASDADGDTLNYSATGLPNGLAIDAASGLISGTPGFDAAGVYDVSVIVSDGGDSTTTDFEWTITDTNRAPEVVNPGAQSSAEGEAVSFAISASDPDGDTLSYSAAGLPDGIVIDSASGLISGTAGFEAAGSFDVTVTVNDGTDTAGTTFAWTVTDTNREPSLTTPADQSSAEGDTVSLPVVADDPDGDALTYSAVNLPAGLSIDASTGVIGGTVGFDAAGAFSVTVTVSDGVESVDAVFNWTVSETNRGPAITGPGDQSSAEGDSISLPVVADDPDGDALSYSATGLPDDLSINPETGLISGTLGFEAAGTFGVTVTVSDGSESAEAVFNWTVTETNRAPTVTTPDDQNNAEGDTVSLPVSADDPDGDALSYSATGLPDGLNIDANTGLISGTLGFDAAGTFTVTVTVSDAGESVEAVFSWTVTETNRAPVVTAPADQSSAEGDTVSLPVTADDPDGDTLNYSATGLPAGLSIDPASGVINGVLTFDSAGSFDVTVTVSDDTDTATAAFVWVVGDTNRAPELTGPGAQSNAEGESVSLPITAGDPDGDTLNYSATGLPGGLSIDPVSGTIGGTLGFDVGGVYNVTVTVADDGTPALSDSVSFDWTVTETNRAPTLTNPGAQSSAEGEGVSVPISADDPDDDSLNYSAEGLPGGLSIDPSSGVIGGTVGFEAAGTYDVTVSVSDGIAGADTTFTWTVSDTNRAPSVTNPGDQAGAEGDSVSLQITANDPDGDALSYSATGLPDGLNIDPATGLIGGVLDNGAAGSHTVRVTVSDGGAPALSDEIAFGWTVTSTNIAPVLAPITDPVVVAEGESVSVDLTASDEDAGDILSFSAEALPAFAGLVDNGDGTASLTLNPGFEDAGDYTTTVAVADDGEPVLTDSRSVTIQVEPVNREPELTSPGDRNNDEGDTVSLQIDADDPDGDVLTYSATGLPAGLAVDPSSGEIGGTLAYDASGAYDVTVTVTDNGTPALSAGVSFTWTVDNTNRSPVLTQPGDQTGTEGDSVSVAISGTDPDGDALTYSATGLPDGLAIDSTSGLISGTLTFDSAGETGVSVTVTDNGSPSLSDTVNFNWSVTDNNRNPEISSPGDQVVAEGESVSLQLTASDPDNDTLTYSATGLPAGLAIDASSGSISGSVDFDSAGEFNTTVTVTDDGSPALSDETAFTWTVQNTNRAPEVVSPGEQTHAEDEAVSVQISANDADGDELNYSATGLPAGLTITSTGGLISGTPDFDTAGTYDVSVTVSDGSDSTVVEFQWIITDTNRAPVLSATGDQSLAEGQTLSVMLSATDPDGDSLSYSAEGLPGFADLTDNGDGTAQISLTPDFTDAGSFTITVTVTDGGSPSLSDSDSFAVVVGGTNRAPSLTAPGAQNNAEGDTVSLSLLASDPDGNELSYSADGLPAGLIIDQDTGLISGSLGFDVAGVYNVTVTVADDGTPSLSDSVSFDWTVTETNRAPTLTNPGAQSSAEGEGVSVPISAHDPDDDSLNYSAEGLPGGLSIDPSSGVIGGTVGFEAAGTYDVTVSVSDGIAGADTTFTWTVSDTNRAPDATNPDDQAGAEGDSVSLQITANDPDGDALSYSASGLPDGLNIDPATGLIGGTVGFDAAGEFSVVVTVADDTESVDVAFGWTITDTNRAPALTAPANQADAEGDTVSLAIEAEDADGDNLAYSATGLPAGLDIDPDTGLISGTVGFDAVGEYDVNVQVDDGSETAGAEFGWTITDTNRAPVLDSIADQSVSEGETLTVALSGTDPDDDGLSFQSDNLPAFAELIDNGDGTASVVFTPSFEDSGNFTVTVTLTDDGSPALTDTRSFDLVVGGTNRAPALSALDDPIVLDEGETIDVPVSASDPDAADILVFGSVDLPGFAVLTDNGDDTGVLSLAPGFEDAGDYTATLTVTDDGTPSLSDSREFTIQVNSVNRGPQISAPGDQTTAEGESVSLPISADDPDGDVLTYSATGLPDGLNIDTATGLISGTPTFDAAGTYSVTVNVDDGNDTANAVFAWTVTATNRAPVVSAPVDQSSAEGESASLQIAAEDPDGDNLAYTATGLPDGLSMDPATGLISGTVGFDLAGVFEVTVTVDDGSSAESAGFNWTITDTNRTPVLEPVADQSVAESDNLTINLTSTDPDGDSLTVQATGLPGFAVLTDNGDGTASIDAEPDFGDAGTFPVTVTVTDNGTPALSDEQSFILTVEGTNRAPQITHPGDQFNAENDAVSLQLASTDPDGDTLSYVASGLPAGLDIDSATGLISGTLGFDAAGEYDVVVTATDNGAPARSAEVAFNWTVENVNRAPVADAGSNRNIEVGMLAALDGSASSDPDGDVLTFAWRFAVIPTGSELSNGDINNAQSPGATFVPDVAGDYVLTLSVSDSVDTVEAQTIVSATLPPNTTPNAEAGDDRSVLTGNSVTLDGSASNDPDEGPDALSYSWRFASVPAGSVLSDADITGASASTATFTPDVDGDYELVLQVSDGRASDEDTVIVTAMTPNVPPTADAGADQTGTINEPVLLDGTATDDPDNGPEMLDYAWTFANVPAASGLTSADITNAASPEAQFTPDVEGTYLLRLDVSDGEAGDHDQMVVEVGSVPNAPAELAARAKSYHVNLVWASGDSAVVFTVFRRLDSEAQFTQVGRTATLVFVDDLPEGSDFADYYVIAENDFGQSPASETVRVTPSLRSR